jgi:ketol-acid reductoisomerase
MSAKASVFAKRQLKLGDTREEVIIGGRDKFSAVAEVFETAGIEKIAVLGWSSQAPAQAQNLRDTLAEAGSSIKVVVGLREGSASISKAEAAGFMRQNGTLQEVYSAIKDAGLVLCLISDAAQAENYNRLLKAVKPGAAFGFSHGFLVGYLQSQGKQLGKIRPDVDFIGVCPKGMGPSVRRLYEQGKTVNGAGINSSFAVEHDATGKAREIALAWAVGIGSPFVFETTLTKEYRSDIFGERAVLLGGVHGIVEGAYAYHCQQGLVPEEAFTASVESLTGPISDIISREGLVALPRQLDESGRQLFEATYAASYAWFKGLLAEIYDEVASGREIAGVVEASHRLDEYPMPNVGGSLMWQTGEKVRSGRGALSVALDPVTSGLYAACMVAQVDLLREQGHRWTEVANESIIEATDSLNPYMHARGVDFMVDNCSMTARLGDRRWHSRFTAVIDQEVLPAITDPKRRKTVDLSVVEAFNGHAVHEVLATCQELRPPVSIAVE